LLVWKPLIAVGVLKLLAETEEPLWCAGLWAVVNTAITVAAGSGFIHTGVVAVGSFALAAPYLWLLHRFEHRRLLWASVYVAGAWIFLW